MHIHAGHMNLNPSTGGAHAALAARRAEETRKKLFASSAEIDALSSSEGAWMADAWTGRGSGGNDSGGNGPNGNGSGPNQGGGQGSDQTPNQLASSQASGQALGQVAGQLSNQTPPVATSSHASSAYGDEVPRTPPAGPVSFWA